MGRVYKPTCYKPLPAGAELIGRGGRQVARWRDRWGKLRTAPTVTPKRGRHVGQLRIAVESRRYVATYRDGDGVHFVPTGCRDELAARGLLALLERRAELVKGNVLSAA